MKKRLYRLTTISCSFNELLRGQLRFLDEHFDVTAVASDTGSMCRVEQEQGVKTIDIRMVREISLWQDIKSLIALYRLFRRDRPDIVHANTPKASLLGMVAAWMARVPHRIYTVTGLRFETTSGLLRFVLKSMERITCLCATKVIPEGDGVRDTLRREHITRKPLEKILNGNINGVNLEYFDRTPEVMAKAKELRIEQKFTFIFVGRMVRDKGMNELVAAFDRLSREYSDVALRLVGRYEQSLDPLLPETMKSIENNPNIHFDGYQSDVRACMVASDVLLLPSYREGFPNVVIQAGAMGLPCIVTDINGCNEIIIDSENGVLIPKQDEEALYMAMRDMYLCRNRCQAMAMRSRDMVAQRYNQIDVWNAILEMYNNL